ncbi:MAG: hypothetical protein EBY22_15865 [Gammaproteobacteria bacterium]|nr:hypothetical protein [Gammaproteobacteria bacterium]
MSNAYDLYIADWKTKHPDVVQPERPASRPNMIGAMPIQGHRVFDNRSKCFELADGKVLEIGQTTNWMDIYAVFPDRKSWASYTQPMTFNEYWNG